MVKKSSFDEIEYLNGLIFRRKFCRWINNNGYDLYINQIGNPASYLTWRLMQTGEKCRISITIYPYLFNQGKKIFNVFPFYIFVKPLLIKYLKSVIGGLGWYAEKKFQYQKITLVSIYGPLDYVASCIGFYIFSMIVRFEQ